MFNFVSLQTQGQMEKNKFYNYMFLKIASVIAINSQFIKDI